MNAPATVLRKLLATGDQREYQSREKRQTAYVNRIHSCFSVFQIGPVKL